MTTIKQQILDLKLDVPAAFHTMDDASLALVMGGCGPGKWGDRTVPDTMWGLSVNLACAVHDLDYALGKDKVKADMRLLINTLIIINTKSKSKVLRVARRYRAMSYYSAVAELGKSSFGKKE